MRKSSTILALTILFACGAVRADAQDDLRFQKTLAFAQAVKKSLRDPKSLQWEDIAANDDGSVICMKYRAKNGFGGTNLEVSTRAQGKVRQGASAWNRYCTREPLNDMMSVRHAL